MSVVISDTSPLRALAFLNLLHLIPKMFEDVLIPQAASEVLIDEYAGRRVAESIGLRTIGVLGILVRAKQRGLVETVVPLMERLKVGLNFYISAELWKQVALLAGE